MHKILKNIYRTDQMPAIGSIRATICYRPPWILMP